jgi:hypothetical protein
MQRQLGLIVSVVPQEVNPVSTWLNFAHLQDFGDPAPMKWIAAS